RRLAGGEATLAGQRAPTELVQLGDDARPVLRALEGRYVTEASDGLVGDAGLDLRGRPAPGHDRRSHPDREGTVSLEVGSQRRQPARQLVVLPVDDGSLGEV